ncbi:cell division protein ZapD [Beggiatoa alba]|nr:cell division protein ZapD [Beggiatoa alba]
MTYELPLNERTRIFMRLEHLFSQLSYTMRGYSTWDSRATLSSLVDILELLARSDFKTELLKELEHLHNALASLRDMPVVDLEQLNTILEQLNDSMNTLHHVDGQLGAKLRNNELIAALLQRNTVIGANCQFDLPAYHFWLQKPAESRIEKIESWYNDLKLVNRPIALILGIIRESANPSQQQAKSGFYQQSLDANIETKLIRVSINSHSAYFAELSGGKHRFTIRFMEPRDAGRPKQTKDDVNFKLNCCSV